MLWLTLLITVVLTTLIVLGLNYIHNNKQKNPELYKNRYTVRGFIWLILNLPGW